MSDKEPDFGEVASSHMGWLRWATREIQAYQRWREITDANGRAEAMGSTTSAMALRDITNKLDDALAALAANAATIDQLNAIATEMRSASGSSTNFAIPNSYADVVSTSLTVPAGFTKASVVVTGSVSGASQAAPGSGDRLYARGVFSGFTSGEMICIMAVGDAQVALPFSFAVDLTGLTAGATLTAVGQAHLITGPSGAFQAYNSATISMQATFRR